MHFRIFISPAVLQYEVCVETYHEGLPFFHLIPRPNPESAVEHAKFLSDKFTTAGHSVDLDLPEHFR